MKSKILKLHFSKHELNIIELIKFFWSKKLKISIILLVSILLGFIYNQINLKIVEKQEIVKNEVIILRDEINKSSNNIKKIKIVKLDSLKYNMLISFILGLIFSIVLFERSIQTQSNFVRKIKFK